MFLNVLMLAGIGGAALPLVLHLLSRARYRSVDWGAMLFLVGADARQQQSAKLKQWLLLLLRMVLVAVLAVALARPILRGRWSGLAQFRGAGISAVIAIDCSASMGYVENGRSRMELAREAALQVLANLRSGDRVGLVLLGSPGRNHVVPPTSDLQAVAARIGDLKPFYGEADMGEALARGADILDRSEEINRELYIICDQQASNWRRIKGGFAAAWRERFVKNDAPVHLFVLPIGGTELDNVAVESMRLVNAPAIKAQPAEVEVCLHNYGTAPQAGVPVSIRLGGRELASSSVTVPAGATSVVRLPARFDEGGSQILSAQIQAAGLPCDDRLDMAIDVVDPVKVLVISSDEHPEEFRSESTYLRLALAPRQAAGKPGLDPMTVKVVGAEKWAEIELKDYQVVVLANVWQFTMPQAKALEQFVYDGGALLIAPGNLAQVENYNALLYHGGDGILPAALSPPTPPDGSGATALVGLDLSHPVFRFLKGRSDPVPSAVIGRSFPAAPRSPDARVLASYVSGQPFLIEGQAGRGRVLLVTTALDADWSTLPLTSFYLPFVQSAVRYLAAGNAGERNLAPLQPIRATVGDLAGDARPSITLPDGTTTESELVVSGNQVIYGNTEQPGRYVLCVKTAGGMRQLHYIVRPARVESDLTALTGQQWLELQASLGFELIDANRQTIASVVGPIRQGRELWGLLLGAVVLLALVELAVARRWSQEGR